MKSKEEKKCFKNSFQVFFKQQKDVTRAQLYFNLFVGPLKYIDTQNNNKAQGQNSIVLSDQTKKG